MNCQLFIKCLVFAVLLHRGKTMGIFLSNYIILCKVYAKSESFRPSGLRKARMVLYCCTEEWIQIQFRLSRSIWIRIQIREVKTKKENALKDFQ